MDINKLIEEDNKKISSEEAIKKAQRNLIDRFEEDTKLWGDLAEKLEINETYRSEVNNFFIDNGFVKSDTDNKGRVFMSGLTTHYKKENTWITVSFNTIDLNEAVIQIILPSNGNSYGLSYKLNDDAMKKLEFEGVFKLNNDFVFGHNYKEIIRNCNSLEALYDLDNQLKEHIQFLKDNLNKNIDNSCVYELQNKKQFKTFKEAFEAL